MGLENVRLRLARAEVAQVAEVSADRADARAAVQAEVAGVAEVFGGSVVDVRQEGYAEVCGGCRGPEKTSASPSHTKTGTCEAHAEVAVVSHSFTHAQARARARARARGEEGGRDALQPTQPLHVPAPAIILRHCRCANCRNFSKVGKDYFCSEYIGGTKVTWATGKRECDPPPDAWHYCAYYHGPQISTDVWLWPRTSRHVGAGSNISVEAEQPDEDEVLI